MAFSFVDVETVQSRTRRDTREYLAPLPTAKRPADMPKAKYGRIVADFGNYNGQSTCAYVHVLTGKECRTNREVCKRFANHAQRIVNAYRKDSNANKSLAVYARKGNARVLIGIVDVFTGKKLVWHDVTVSGIISRDGSILPKVTNKLHDSTIRAYLYSRVNAHMRDRERKDVSAMIDGLTVYSERIR